MILLTNAKKYRELFSVIMEFIKTNRSPQTLCIPHKPNFQDLK